MSSTLLGSSISSLALDSQDRATTSQYHITPSQSKQWPFQLTSVNRLEKSLTGPTHPPKVKYSLSDDFGNILLSGPTHPPKEKYHREPVPNGPSPLPLNSKVQYSTQHTHNKRVVISVHSRFPISLVISGPAHPPKVKYSHE